MFFVTGYPTVPLLSRFGDGNPWLVPYRDSNKEESTCPYDVTLGLTKLPQLHYSHTFRWGVVVADDI